MSFIREILAFQLTLKSFSHSIISRRLRCNDRFSLPYPLSTTLDHTIIARRYSITIQRRHPATVSRWHSTLRYDSRQNDARERLCIGVEGGSGRGHQRDGYSRSCGMRSSLPIRNENFGWKSERHRSFPLRINVRPRLDRINR